jgi:integrase
MSTTMTMAAKVERYLRQRRHAGFALKIEGKQLARFACFADEAGHQGPLTIKLAMKWAMASRRQKLLTAARRIEVLRPFARYCQQFEPATEIPSRHLFGPAHRRLTPHIFSDEEVRTLIRACAGLHPVDGLRAAACAAIFGLIASTGLRISEATRLRRADVNLHDGLLHIHHTKFGNDRRMSTGRSCKNTRVVPSGKNINRSVAAEVRRRHRARAHRAGSRRHS